MGGAVVLATRKDGGGGASQGGIRLVPSGGKVVLVGDSIGVGLAKPLGVLLQQAGVLLVTADQGVPLVVTGKTVKGLLPLLKTHAGVFQGASSVLLSFGSNDAAMADPGKEVPEVEDMVSLVTSGGGQAVWIVPPSYRLVSDAVPPPATSHKQDVFETILTVGLPVERVTPSNDVMAELSPADSIHLRPKGYSLYAMQIATTLTGFAGA